MKLYIYLWTHFFDVGRDISDMVMYKLRFVLNSVHPHYEQMIVFRPYNFGKYNLVTIGKYVFR